MPRYLFKWENLSPRVLEGLTSSLPTDSDRISHLKATFGVRPKTDFIRSSWKLLLECWFEDYPASFGKVVSRLRELNLGNSDIVDF